MNPDESLDCGDELDDNDVPDESTEELLEVYERRFENGYDIFTDKKYVAWLQKNHPDSIPQTESTELGPAQQAPSHGASYSPSEVECFEKRLENGYDIFTDEKYVAWLREYHPDSVSSIASSFAYVTPLEESEPQGELVPS